ncbi:MAG: MFS transporter [Methylobacteriaceae bacterium]|nr:MFS transporter [Methylobacteriaceae bacterium]
MLRSRQFRLLTIHFGLYQLAVAMAGGFVGAFLLKLGFSLPQALIAYAALLATRLALRFLSLLVVRRIGYRGSIVAGATLAGLQCAPLTRADEPAWLALWLLALSLAEAFYWPVYHSAAAVTSETASRGRELGLRTAIGSTVGVVGPLLGGVLLQRFGPAVDFGIAGALSIAAAFPVLLMRRIEAGPVPSLAQSVRNADRQGVLIFAADGWMAAGLAIGWPMVLYLSTGSRFEEMGFINAASGLVGAVAGWLCGRAIDRQDRERYLALVSGALALGLLVRALASWVPAAAIVATATGAAVMSVYVPLMMSAVYERAKRSGAAYRFHFGLEAGWDLGAVAGCCAAATVASFGGIASLAVLPSLLGVAALYLCVRECGHRPQKRPVDVAPVPIA